MKRVLIWALGLVLICGSASFASQFGPAEPGVKKGQYSLGAGIFRYSGESEGDVDTRQTQAYAQAGYGIAENWEVYVQVGAADLEVENALDKDFDDDFMPFGTLGVRALLFDRQPVAMGVFLQGSYFSDYEDSGTFGGQSAKLEIDQSYEVNAGFALQTVLEGAILYAGPFLYLREADLTLTTASGPASGDLEEDGNLGGFVGIRWPLKNGLNIELEGQIKTKFSAGGSIQYVF